MYKTASTCSQLNNGETTAAASRGAQPRNLARAVTDTVIAEEGSPLPTSPLPKTPFFSMTPFSPPPPFLIMFFTSYQ